MPTTASSRELRALTIIRVAGTAVIVLMLAFLSILPAEPVHQGLPGLSNPLLSFELASTPEHVFGILGRPGEPARADAVRRTDLGNRLDFLFMIAYPALFVGIAFLLEAHGSFTPGMRAVVVALALLMAAGDALENRELLFLSGASDGAAMGPALARLRIFTHVKWYAIFATSGLIAAGTWRERDWWRWSAPLYALAGLCGFASVVYLPGIEIAMYVLAIAWVMTYVRAWRGSEPESVLKR